MKKNEDNHFKGYNFPKEIIKYGIYLYLRFSLSYRDIEELMEIRGVNIDHSNIQRWVVKFSPIFENIFKAKKKSVGKSWRMDETYIKVKGKWVYLYRAVDKDGNTIDFLLRKKRDKKAAKDFFIKAIKNSGIPEKVNIDKSGSNKAALKDINKESEVKIEIRQNKYLNNRIEGDHRFIKRIVRPMLGFKEFHSAENTLAGIELVRMIKKGQMNAVDNSKTAYGLFCSLIA